MYSIQFAAPSRRRVNASTAQRARAWDRLLRAFLTANPGRDADNVTALEVSLWKASRK
jgi:hypothetical protein